MAGLPPVFVEFLGKSTGIKTAMADIKAETGKAAAEGETSFSKFGRVSKAAVMGIGIAAAAAAVGTVKMAADFQDQMTKLNTQAGVSKDKIKGLGDGVLALAGQVGFSPDSLAESLYHVESSFASTGITGQKALDILKVAAEGAAVGHANLVDVQNALDAAIASGIPGVENYGQAMGALNAIVGSGDMQMQDLADAMGTGVLAIVKGYGVTLNDVGAALATFGDNNIRGANAATDLRMAVQALAVPAKAGTEALKNMGLSTTSLQKEMQEHGLTGALNDLMQHMRAAGITAKDQGATITEIFGKKAGSGLAVLLGQLDRYNSKVKEVAKGASGFQSAWAGTQATFSQRMKEAKASLQALGIEIGNVLLPWVSKMAKAFGTVVTWLTKHKTIAESLAILIGTALVGAIVAVTYAMYAWITSAAVMEAIPWVAAITAIIVVILLLATHWKQVWGLIKEVALDVWHFLETVWDGIKSGAITAWNAVGNAITTAWHAIANFFATAWHAVVNPIVSAWNSVVNFTKTIWNAILGFFKKWWPLLLVIFFPYIAAIVALWNHFHKQIMDVVKTVWNWISSFLKKVWDEMKATAKGDWAFIKEYIVQPIQAVYDFLKSVWNAIYTWLVSRWNSIRSSAVSLWNSIKTAMINPLTSAWHSIVSVISNIATSIWNGLVKAWDAVKNVGSWFKSIGSSIVWGIINGVESSAGSLFNSLKGLASSALNAAKSFLGINSPSKVFASVVGMAIPEGIAKGVDDHAHLAHASVSSLARNLASERADLGSVMLETGAYSSYAAANGGNGVPLQQEIYFQLDGQTLFKGMQKATLQYNRRNRSNGLSLAQ
jgi:TP901 family phage tail tape measure protein